MDVFWDWQKPRHGTCSALVTDLLRFAVCIDAVIAPLISTVALCWSWDISTPFAAETKVGKSATAAFMAALSPMYSSSCRYLTKLSKGSCLSDSITCCLCCQQPPAS
ncbi:TPA: hypothetical protein ACH3X1_009778 [Trebouxia sp. C0004]